MIENKLIEIIQFLLQEKEYQKLKDFSKNGMEKKLKNKGFMEKDINNALKLFNFNSANQKNGNQIKKIRTFHEIERAVISKKLQGTFIKFYDSGLLSSLEFETLIEEIMIVYQINNDSKIGWVLLNKFLIQKFGFPFFDEFGDFIMPRNNNFH